MKPQPDRPAWLYGPDAPCPVQPQSAGMARRIILVGVPGIGKGTQAELLCQHFGVCHLSTSEVFRSIRSADKATLSPATCAAREFLDRGRLISDDAVLALVRERVACLRCRGGFLLEGFPRTLTQALALDRLLDSGPVALDAVVNYELPFDEIAVRLGGRRVCPDCRLAYHLTRTPPRVAGHCDRCKTVLVQREDDRPEVIQLRLAAYERITRPLLDYYGAKGELLTVSAAGTPPQIFARTLRALG